MNRLVDFTFIITTSLMLVAGQLMWKIGLNRLVDNGVLDLESRFAGLLQILTNYWIILGLVVYAVATTLWLFVLARVDLSTAYPMMSLSYVIGAILGIALLGEVLTTDKVIGVALIMGGVMFMARGL